jgi:hypothetical protein
MIEADFVDRGAFLVALAGWAASINKIRLDQGRAGGNAAETARPDRCDAYPGGWR